MIDKQVLLFILLNYSYKFVSCYNSYGVKLTICFCLLYIQ